MDSKGIRDADGLIMLIDVVVLNGFCQAATLGVGNCAVIYPTIILTSKQKVED